MSWPFFFHVIETVSFPVASQLKVNESLYKIPKSGFPFVFTNAGGTVKIENMNNI